MKITCPHCGAARVTLLLNRGREEHGIMVEHLVPEGSTIVITAYDAHGEGILLDVRQQCDWGNAMVRVR